MATMDDNALFVDTNVLIYANVIETPFHEQAYGIPALLTHNTKDFERFGEIIRIEGI